MLLNVNYGKQQFAVEVQERVGKNLSITVYPDLSIVAKVPSDADKKTIEKRLLKKAAWMSKQLDYFSKFHPLTPERKYIGGETHYYLGRQYRLKIRKSKKTEMKLKGRYFIMGSPDPNDNMQAKKIMQDWYTKHAAVILTKRVTEYLPKFIKLGAKKPALKFRRMEKRWGSCSKKGTITF